MEKVSGKAKELLEKFKALSKKIKIIMLVAVIAIIIAIISAIVYAHNNKYGVLFSNLEPKDAQTVMSALDDEGITYKSDSKTNSILVPKDKVDELNLKLAPNLTSGSTGYELMDNSSSFGLTDEEFKIKKQRMLEGELERMIKKYSQIADAKVKITEATDSVFVKEKQQGSAAVQITLKKGQELTKDQVKSIVAVISKSCKDTPEENITVTDQEMNLLTKDLNKDDANSVDDETVTKQHKLESAYEEGLRQKILKILQPLAGNDKVNASVNVDLDFDAIQKTQTTVDPNKVIISQESSKEENTTSGGDVTESPVDNNMQNEINSNNENTSSSSEQQKTNYEIGKNEIKTINAPGEVKRITASVVIDKKLSAAEQKQYQQAVQNAIGFDVTRGDNVSILGAQFDTTLADEAAKQQEEYDKKIADRKRNIYIALGIVGALILFAIVFVLIRKIRSKKQEQDEQLLDTLIDDSLIPKEPEVFTPIDFEVQNQKSHLEKEIKRYATEKPEQVVDIIKSWLAEDER